MCGEDEDEGMIGPRMPRESTDLSPSRKWVTEREGLIDGCLVLEFVLQNKMPARK